MHAFPPSSGSSRDWLLMSPLFKALTNGGVLWLVSVLSVGSELPIRSLGCGALPKLFL